MTADKTARIQRFQTRLGQLGIESALLIYSRDVLYYCGTAQPAILVVTPGDYYLIVRRALDFVLKEIWIDPNRVIAPGSFQEALLKIKELGAGKGKLGLEMDVMPAELFLKIRQIFTGYTPVNISPEILMQRMLKDEEEIELIKTACAIMKAGHLRVFDVLSPGMTELELAAEIEYAHRKAGHEGDFSMRNFDFYMSRGPLSSGENLLKVSGFANTITGIGLSPAIPAGPSARKISPGDTIIVDIPTCYQGYHCDETRTYVLGEPAPEVESLFQCLSQITDDVRMSLKEGIKCGELYNIAWNSACRLGVSDYFLGLPPRKGNFIGHGVGLELNEPPVLFAQSDFKLKANSIITLEMHLTHPQHGAVKRESMFLITENGHETLSVTEQELFDTTFAANNF
jgi:Xaa-Pro aminopeptidase